MQVIASLRLHKFLRVNTYVRTVINDRRCFRCNSFDGKLAGRPCLYRAPDCGAP